MSVVIKEEVSTSYVEVKELRVTGHRHGSKFRFVFKHDSGAQEVFEADLTAGTSFPCETYLAVAGTNTTLQVRRRDRGIRSSSVSEKVLALKDKTGGWFDVDFPSEFRLRVEIKFGATVTAAQVADKRLEKAMIAMDSKRKMMDILKTGCNYLSLLAGLGEALSDVHAAAGAVASIAQSALERARGIPESFQKLSDVAIELIEEMESNRARKKVFSSKDVKKALDRLIGLIIRTGEELIYYYSRSKTKLFIKEWLSPRHEEIERLGRELEAHRKKITQAFLVEVQSGINKIQGDVADIKVGVNIIQDGTNVARRQAEEKEKKELLDKLLPPTGSVYYGQVTCFEGTRKRVLDSVDEWVSKDAGDAIGPLAHAHQSRLFWIHGVAGCGKSSVAATICHNLKHRLAGSFFCKRDQEERRRPVRILWSVAFNLARSNLAYKEALLKALREPEDPLNLDFDTQLDLILLQPLSAASVASMPTRMVFVIDALDECNSSGQVARALAKIVQSSSCILFVLTSRGLPEIRRGLTSLESLSLKIDYNLFEDDARKDIDTYLRHQLASDEGLVDLEPYVEEEQIRNLVDKSQGLFIWMRTVVEFIIRTEVGKLKALESILTTEKAAASESALDDIYKTVLETASGTNSTAKELVRLILGLILVTSRNEPLTPEALHAFLPSSLDALQTEFDTILKKMSPVLLLGSSGVRVYHTSFLDFSSSQARCGATFYTNATALNSIMAFGCFEIMQSGTRNRKRQSKKVVKTGLMFNICRFESSYLADSEVVDFDERVRSRISQELAYSACYWLEHIVRSDITQENERRAIVQMLEELLCSPRSLYWLELLAIYKKLATARAILLRLQAHSLVVNCAEIKDAVANLRSFIDQFQVCILENTSHLYLSTMPWLSSGSFLWKAWQSTFKVGMALVRPVQQQSIMLHHLVQPKKIHEVSINADGSLFATGGYENVVSIFDMQTGRQSGLPLKGHIGAITALAFSPMDNILVSASELENCFRVWDMESRTEAVEPVVAHDEYIRTLAFSSDGTRLATGSAEGTIRVWGTENWKSVGNVLKGHEDRVLSVAFSPNGTRLASSSERGDICLWNWNLETFERFGDVMRMHEGRVDTLLFSPDGFTVFSGGEDSTIRVWDAHSGTDIIPPLRGHQSSVFSLAITSDGSLLLSGSGDSAIQVWDAKTGQSLGTPIKGPQLGYVPSFALSSDGTRGVIAGGHHDVTVWDIHAALRKASVRGHSHDVLSVAISPDGSRFASGGWENSVFVWASSGKLLNDKSMDHDAPVLIVQFSPDGTQLMSADEGGIVRTWDVETYSKIREFKVTADKAVNAAVWSRDGTRLAVATQGFLQLWDTEAGKPVGNPLQEDALYSAQNIAYSPDGSRVAIVDGRIVRVWNVATGMRVEFEGHTKPVSIVTFSPDGSTIASGGTDQSVRFWDASTGRQILEPFMHSDDVQSLAFSSDGRIIFSASQDRLVWAWNANSGKLMGLPLRGHTRTVNCLAVSRDGKTLLSGGHDHTIRVWDVQSFFRKDAEDLNYNCKLLGADRIPESIPEDGWVRTASGKPVLWIPSDLRTSICDMSRLCISTDQELHPIRIRWDEICEGRTWERIRV